MPNQLCHELSPYLLQHAGNPVDWRPWGTKALMLARTEQKPIFLSIGYASCHWCHVMAHESFENPEIAQLLNDHFVCVKVDREERFDLDQIYLEAVQMMTGRGGWPLSVFLTPEGEPFFGGTFWPPRARDGVSGFDEVLLAVADQIMTQFADPKRGGFFFTAVDHEPLIVRKMDYLDNPTPSGSGLTAMLLLRLQAISGGDDYRVAAEAAFRACFAWMRQVPTGAFQLLLAMDLLQSSPRL